MSFDVAGSAYSRFMGRYSEPLAVPFTTFAGVSAGDHVVDVGCGPGALTAHLCSVTHPAHIAAVDPSPPFVDTVKQRCPEADVHLAAAEMLPFPDDVFDVALAELVVHFMSDPVAGLREMARVCKPGGQVAACVWDGATGALGPFWRAVHAVDPSAQDESALAGARQRHLAELFAAAGLEAIEAGSLTVEVLHPSFEQWWEPYTLGVGPAGAYVAQLDDDARERVASAARAALGAGPFTVSAIAWAARGLVGSD
jgi:SAM-dependent methyltransferase